jgi:hypothetical protein
MSKIWKALEHAQHKIMDTENLIKDKDKSKIRIPLNTLYGSKYLLCVINFALICVVIILSIISASIYFFIPLIDEAKLSRVLDIQEDNALPDIKSIEVDFSEEEKQIDGKYTIISTKNVFSPQRKEWVVKATIPKSVELAKKRLSKKKKAFSGKPKKFILHGIVIAGDIKKALIKNPMTGVSGKRTLYVEEGEEIEGYTVTSIESDQIRLDWQGEEIIVKLYTGLEGVGQQEETEEVSRVKPRKARIRDLHAMEDVTERHERDKKLPEDTFELAPPELLMMEQESEPK